MKQVTWKLHHNVPDGLDRGDVLRAISGAIRQWETACQARFDLVGSAENAHVFFLFRLQDAETIITHGKRGHVVAFDSGTDWVVPRAGWWGALRSLFDSGTMLAPHALHAVGRVLGLPCSEDPANVMHPPCEHPDFPADTLSTADIRAALQIHSGDRASWRCDT